MLISGQNTPCNGPGDPRWVILSMKNWLSWSIGTYPNIKSWLAVQMNRLKLIQDEQMAENDDFQSKRPPKWSRWPPVDDIVYEKLVGMINGNLS